MSRRRASLGPLPQTHVRTSYPRYASYFGDEVDEDGSINSSRIAEALSATEAEHPLEALHQALHELAAFALFSATTTLPRDQELILARDVNRRLKLIRI